MNLNKVRLGIISVLIAVSFGSGGYLLGVKSSGLTSIKGKDANVDVSLMNEALDRIKASYLKTEDIDSKKMAYGAAEGVVASLGDPYTAFYPPVNNVRSKEDLQGEFGGVGIQLGFVEKNLAVMSPIKDSPAMKAGVLAGDLILKIRDENKKINKDTSGITLEDAVDMIRGQKGSTVFLTTYREGGKETKEVALVRDTINVPSTEIEWLDNNRIALIRVNKFGEKTLPEWEAIVSEVINNMGKGIILDLRNNPGGYLQRAIDLASEFVPDGVIVSQRDRLKTEDYKVVRRGKFIGMPVVVLINKGSASASEILAGALKERLGTKLIGEKSFGKGTVQEVEELTGGAGLHVTIAEWLLPSGKNIHHNGLDPDVEVKFVPNEKNPKADNQLDKAVEVLKGQIK